MKYFTVKTLICILLIIGSFSSCHVARYFYYNVADVNDYRKFPQSKIESPATPFEFIAADQKDEIQLPSYLKSIDIQNFDQFLEQHKTLSFILIRNDSILYEKYFDGYDETSVLPSFSVSKVFVSALMGISTDKGKIHSVNDSMTTYIPSIQRKGLEGVTIEHLLDMRSGIGFEEGYSSPFSDMAKYYYGLNLKKYIKTLQLKEAPGESYNYISVNSLLLGMAIENAWDMPLPEILEKELWQPLGMEFDASWNLDSKKHKAVKTFCCLNARARDFAKLGKLYLQLGNWQGKQLISRDWIEKSLTIHNNSIDSQGYNYSYQWRVLDSVAYFAKGILGQFIFVYPAKNIIIVRMGKSADKVHWPRFFEALCEEL